jgi:hypothetical protein
VGLVLHLQSARVNQLRLWTHDNYGENLIINPRGAGIYRWVENNGTSVRALELSGISGANLVPTVALQVITSETDRHLVVLGADPISGSSRTGVIDPMLVAFSDQENELDFEPTATNTAGSLTIIFWFIHRWRYQVSSRNLDIH